MHFSILGPTQVRDDDGNALAIAHIPRRLLTLLLFAEGEPVSAKVLIQAVWNASHNDGALKSAVAKLRPQIPGRIPDREGAGYRLVLLPGDSFDVVDFRTQVAETTAALNTGGEPVAAVRALRAALGMWGHPPLPDLPDLSRIDESLHRARDRLLFRRRSAQNALFDAQMELGLHHDLIEDLHTELAMHPADEDLHVLLIRALLRLGQRAEALRHYSYAEAAIGQATGREPSPVLRQLHDEITAAPAAALSPAVPAPAADAQVAAAAVPVRPSLPVPAQLPPDVADFTGRDQEITSLLQLLRPTGLASAPPIVTISGLGGVGKSTLARHVAHRLREHYPDGQLFVRLASRSHSTANISEILAGLLSSLKVPAHEVPTATPERAAMLRSLLAGRRMLIVIDDALDADQIEPFLPGEARCAVIITSRSFITGPGFKNLRLEPLPPADMLRMLEKIIMADRITADPEATHAVMEACGGLPLAVRIVGSRLAAQPHWQMGLMAARLRDRLEGLDRLATDNKTMTAIIAESYDTLSPIAQHGMRVLALAGPNDWPMWLAEMLLGTEDADTALGALTMHSLLTPAGVDELGHPRYQMHDLVRDFSDKQLTLHRTERDMAMNQLLGGWMVLADHASARTAGDPGFTPPARISARDLTVPSAARELIDVDAEAWLAGESSQILSVIRLACSNKLYQLAYGLAVRLAAHLYRRGRWRDADTMWRTILLVADGAGDIRLATDVRIRVAALIADRLDIAHQALPMLDACVSTCEQLKDWQPWSRALAWRALCRYRMARRLQGAPDTAEPAAQAQPKAAVLLEQARADLKQALELAELIEEPWLETMCQRVLSLVASAQGHHEEAIASGRLALQRAQQLSEHGDDAYQAAAVLALSKALLAAGHHEAALGLCQDHHGLIQRTGNVAAAAALAERTGDAQLGLHRYAAALASYERAVELCGTEDADPLRARYVDKLRRARQHIPPDQLTS
ncbi:hypothetical protein GCM10010156_66560 [Planobispora rosea]|uniref:SARP family transcriptional regulator n=1 Tax=Planobispora rosea TaxID=35762 RepID=A0A8J3S726_PLARO|nr:BTAD domain-containing putative transcriptional regulator [Planobispora rosea]GGS99095.1 hypothetical protein GCM10010156_66560 [Planobispora rosea]GIH88019.1 hypothetical protein Pro02_64270 [Planobispora rosea]